MIVWIIVGAIAGFLASKVLTGRGMGLICDMVVGILGGFQGGWLAGLAGIAAPIPPRGRFVVEPKLRK